MERFDQDKAALRREWLHTRAGAICCWELDAADSCRIVDLATRPPEDPRGGMDRGEAKIWEIALSCRHGDAPGAERVWPDHEVHRIHELPYTLFSQILDAVNAVNGESPTELERVRDFTPAAEAPITSG